MADCSHIQIWLYPTERQRERLDQWLTALDLDLIDPFTGIPRIDPINAEDRVDITIDQAAWAYEDDEVSEILASATRARIKWVAHDSAHYMWDPSYRGWEKGMDAPVEMHATQASGPEILLDRRRASELVHHIITVAATREDVDDMLAAAFDDENPKGWIA